MWHAISPVSHASVPILSFLLKLIIAGILVALRFANFGWSRSTRSLQRGGYHEDLEWILY